jgi:hypothetical protein
MTTTQTAEVMRKDIQDGPAQWHLGMNMPSFSLVVGACGKYYSPQGLICAPGGDRRVKPTWHFGSEHWRAFYPIRSRRALVIVYVLIQWFLAATDIAIGYDRRFDGTMDALQNIRQGFDIRSRSRTRTYLPANVACLKDKLRVANFDNKSAWRIELKPEALNLRRRLRLRVSSCLLKAWRWKCVYACKTGACSG